jgi:hypothetical protein
MVMLDCEGVDTALTSLSAAGNVSEDALFEVLRGYEPDDMPAGVDPWEAIPRAVFTRLGVAIDDIRFDGAYYFTAHACWTRKSSSATASGRSRSSEFGAAGQRPTPALPDDRGYGRREVTCRGRLGQSTR